MSDIEILKNESGINLDYDEISPVTGNKCVIIEADTETGDEHRMCMESGYVTRSSLKFGSDAVTEYEKGCTELMIVGPVVPVGTICLLQLLLPLLLLWVFQFVLELLLII